MLTFLTGTVICFSIWVLMWASIPSPYSRSWTQVLKVIQPCLQFGSAWSGWTVIMKDTKRPDCLWADVRGLLVFIFLPSSSWTPESFKVKTAWSDVSMVWPQKSKRLLSPFPPGFHWGSYVNKTVSQISNLCGAITSSSWNFLQCWVVELMLFICGSIGSNHRWNLVWISVPYYFFCPPRRGREFSSS